MYKSKRGQSWSNELPWHSRHHVTASRNNTCLPKTNRSYFDWLGGVRWKRGEFDDVLVTQPDVVGFKEHEEMLQKRFHQFPQFFYGRPRLRNEAKGLPVLALERGLAQHIGHVLRSPAKARLPRGTMLHYLNSSVDMASVSQADDQEPSRNLSGGVELADNQVQGHTGHEGQSHPASPHQVEHFAEVQRPHSEQTSGHHKASPQRVSPHQSDHRESIPARTSNVSDDPYATPLASPRNPAESEKRQLWGAAKKQLEIQGDTEITKQFAEWCNKKHTHVVGVWRLLDSDKNMVVGKHEFLQGMRKLDYPGCLEALWSSLDRDHTGSLSFMEFAPEHALDLARFKHWAVECFGSVKASFKALDADGNGRLTFEEFNASCLSEGLPSHLKDSIRMLFLLVDDPNDYSSRGTITSDEMVFLDTWQCPVYLREKADMVGRMQLQQALLERHDDNALAAWRLELDRDSSMRVNFQEFSTACHRLAR